MQRDEELCRLQRKGSICNLEVNCEPKGGRFPYNYVVKKDGALNNISFTDEFPRSFPGNNQ